VSAFIQRRAVIAVTATGLGLARYPADRTAGAQTNLTPPLRTSLSAPTDEPMIPRRSCDLA